MKVLVTGATGFLGRQVLKRIAAEGVPGLAEPVELLGLSRRAVDIGVPLRLGDILDQSSMEAAFAGVDVVVHAAGDVSHHPADALKMWDVHVRGTEYMMEAARRARVRRVVYLSSSGTIGISRDAEAVADEDSPAPMDILQQWSYYRAKCYAEKSALAVRDVEVICLNPSLLLGPGDTRGTSTRPVRYFLARRIPAVPPGGLSFVDVRDVAATVAAAVTRGQPGRRYLLGAANMTFLEFDSRIARISGMRPPMKLPSVTRRFLEWLPEATLPGFEDPEERIDIEMACYTWYIKSDRATAELGFRPRDAGVTLHDTVESVTQVPALRGDAESR